MKITVGQLRQIIREVASKAVSTNEAANPEAAIAAARTADVHILHDDLPYADITQTSEKEKADDQIKAIKHAYDPATGMFDRNKYVKEFQRLRDLKNPMKTAR